MDTIKLKLPAQAHLRLLLLLLYKRPQGTVREAVKGQTESMIFSSGGNQKQARRKQRKQSPPPPPPPQQQQQRRLSQTLPEQKAKLYIIYRCIVMLLCCHD